jgi:spermidine synthase
MLMIQLLVTGFVSILGQVVLLRETSVALFGVELFYVLAMGSWLLWTAVGASVGRHTRPGVLLSVPFLFAASGLSLPCGLLLARAVRTLLGAVPGAYLPLWQQILAAVVPLVPSGVLSGLLFRTTASEYMERGNTLASAYAIESAGGLAGGLVSTLALAAGLSNLQTALVCSVVSFSAMTVGPGSTADRTHYRRYAGLALMAISLGTLPYSSIVDRRTTAWNHTGEVLEVVDGPYGRLTVTALEGQVSLFENDALTFASERTSAEEFVHLALLQLAEPRKVLILGSVAEGTVQAALEHRPSRIDVVELNPLLPELILRHLPGGAGWSVSDPRVHLVHGDPRQFLGKGESYDTILVGMPEPSSGQTNRFYTQEFFRLCRDHLSDGGVLAFRLQSSENYWTPELKRRVGSVYQALRTAFPSVVVLPGTVNIFLASTRALGQDPEQFGTRMLQRGVHARLVSPQYLRFLYHNDRFAEIERIVRESDAPPNTDERPVVYRQTMSLWVSRFTGLSGWDPTPGRGPASLFASVSALAGLAGLILVRKRRPRLGRIILVGVAGFNGMILETLALLHYQVQRGVLYRDVGILLMSFMAGLSLGAFVIGRWGNVQRDPRGIRLRGTGLLLGFVAIGGGLALSYGTGREAGLPEAVTVLLMSGGLVAAVFAHAAHAGGYARGDVGPLYAADLAGGSMGAVLGSLFLVPLAGLAWTAFLTVPLALACLLLV